MARDFNHEIMSEIKERWSPRAFSQEAVAQEDLMALFEAARYAPSCFNEQPSRFIVAETPDELAKMQSILAESNLVWAKHAPVLVLVLSHKLFSQNGKDNYWHMFDAGTAFGYLSLEAVRRGLITHAMGGFSRKKAQESYNIPEDITIVAVIAVGKPGNRADLTPELQEREEPGLRRPLDSFFYKEQWN